MPENSKINFAGIEVAQTAMRGVVVSNDGEVITRRDGSYQPENLVGEIVQLVSGLKEAGPIKSVGLGIPGLVNRETDRVLISTGLPSARDDIHSELMKATGLRFELENDANAGAYGEYKAGAGRGARDIFYIGIGESIGGAILFDGKLWTGSSGCAGEIGHVTIINEGAECECGNSGCLETVAGKQGILTEAQRSLPDLTTITQVIEAARDGNIDCTRALQRAGNYLGFALAGLVNSLNPCLIVLDGSTIQAGDLLLQPLQATLEAHSLQAPFTHTRVTLAEQSGIAMPLGGIATVLDAVFHIT